LHTEDIRLPIFFPSSALGSRITRSADPSLLLLLGQGSCFFFPKNNGFVGTHHPLTEGEMRVDANADQPRLFELDRVSFDHPHQLQGRPLLASDLDVLALFWQMAQPARGWSLSAYCVPQVVQMKFGMAVLMNKGMMERSDENALPK
jgi:hypothetical protein